MFAVKVKLKMLIFSTKYLSKLTIGFANLQATSAIVANIEKQ